jgi:hypothetical protein
MAKTWDRKKLVMMFAVDNFTGGWDSYSGPIVNNYYVRSSATGKLTMMPWGVDQTFGENRQTPVPLDDYFFAMDSPNVGFPWVQEAFHKSTRPRGRLFAKCLSYAPCKTEYLNDLMAVAKKVTSSNLAGFMKNLSNKISEFSANVNNADPKLEQQRTIAWVGKQVVKVKALMKKNGIKY